jgi:hypothetical protein
MKMIEDKTVVAKVAACHINNFNMAALNCKACFVQSTSTRTDNRLLDRKIRRLHLKDET